VTTDEGWSPRQSEEVARLLGELAAAEPGSETHRRLREQILELHLPLVRYLARRFVRGSVSMDDLVQVGSIGLIKAIDRFDPERGYEFASYAVPTVIGELKQHLRATGWLLHVPRRAQELQTSVARARDELSQQLGRDPSIAEIANRVGVSGEEIAETLDVERTRDAMPLDLLIDPAEGGSPSWMGIEEPGFQLAEVRAVLRDALESLSEQEKHVVLLRFVEGKTQSEIAKVIGVSQMQVSRLLSRSLDRMRRLLE